MMDDPDHWWDQAACHGADTELFFPAHSTAGKRRPQVRKVVANYCLNCPVRRECFEDAIAWGDHYGVRGGYDLQAPKVQDYLRSARAIPQFAAVEALA